MDIEFVRSRFIKHFDGKTGNVYSSPGRINLIGEHTDYNGVLTIRTVLTSNSQTPMVPRLNGRATSMAQLWK